MTCGLRCNRRILLEDPVPLKGMESLDLLRERITQDRLDQLIHEFGIPVPLGFDARDAEDAFVLCVANLFSIGVLAAYVADLRRADGFRMRLEVMQGACRCYSLMDSIREGRLITKPALLCHGSREVGLDGQPLYISDANQIFQRQRTTEKRLTEIIKGIIDDAVADGSILANAELERLVRNNPEIHRVSRREILRIASQIKPKEWSQPGPRRRVRDK